MTPEEFIASLKSGVPAVVVCAGEETFFKEEILQAVKDTLNREAPGFPMNNFELAQGEKSPAGGGRLLGELMTPMLFGGKTLFIVRNGEDLLKQIAKDLGGWLDRPEKLPNRAIFFVRNVDGRTKFAKKLKAANGLIQARKLYATPPHWQKGNPDDSELSRWARKRARLKGIELSPQAATFLATQTGNDLFRLDGELEKLCLFLPKGEKNVDIEEIERMTGASAVHTPFDLWERIESGRRSAALETLSLILRNGLRAMGGKLETDGAAIAAILLGMFRDRVKMASRVALLEWEKRTDDVIMQQLKISSAFYLTKLKASARRLTADNLRIINRALLTAERRIKRQGLLAIPVLEELVVKLAGADK